MGLRTIVTLAGLVGIGASAGPAWAHGGYYQGPKTTDGIPLPTDGSGPSGPTTDPDNPPPYGPAVTGRDRNKATTPGTGPLPPALAEPSIRGSQWEHWWALHKTRYLRLALDRRPEAGATAERSGDGSRPEETARLSLALRTALGSDSADVRAAAALALARMRVADARTRLHTLAAEDASPDVRVSAALALLVLADEEDLPRLDQLLTDRSQRGNVRCLAALALGRVGGDDAAAALRGVLPTGRPGEARVPPALVATVFYALGFTQSGLATGPIRAAIEPRYRAKGVVKSFAELAAGRLGDREALPTLLVSLQNSGDVSMRRSAALAVGKLAQPPGPEGAGDREALALLLGLAKASGEPGLRRFCALALGGVDSEEVRDRLRTAFTEAKPLDRPFLALALALQGDRSSGTLLRDAFREDQFEESLQGVYAIALGILGDGRAAKLLEEEVGRQDRQWSPGYAALALAMIGSQGSRELIHERMQGTKDRRLRTKLAVALGLLGDPRPERDLTERFTSAATIHERATAAIALGWLRSRSALPALARLARATDGEDPAILRAAAITAVGRILAPEGPSPLLEILEGHNFSIDLPPLMEVAAALNER